MNLYISTSILAAVLSKTAVSADIINDDKEKRKDIVDVKKIAHHVNSSYNNKKKENKYGNNNGMLVDSTDPYSKQLTAINKHDAVDTGILHDTPHNHHSSGKPQVSSTRRHQRLLGTKAGKPTKNMQKKIRELEMKLQAKEDELDKVKAELSTCQGEKEDNDGNDNVMVDPVMFYLVPQMEGAVQQTRTAQRLTMYVVEVAHLMLANVYTRRYIAT